MKILFEYDYMIILSKNNLYLNNLLILLNNQKK